MQNKYKDIKGIVFDKDGTLFNFNAVWSVWCERWLDVLAQGNAELVAILAGKIGYDPASKTFEPNSIIVGGAADEASEILCELLPDHWTREKIDLAGEKASQTLPLPPAADFDVLFNALKKARLTLGVATNDFEASAHNQLKQAGISAHFDFVCGFNSGFGSKPAAGMIEGFIAATGIKAQDVMMVGDSTHDLRAGKSAGVGCCVGVLTGPSKREDLLPFADVILADIGELPALLSLK